MKDKIMNENEIQQDRIDQLLKMIDQVNQTGKVYFLDVDVVDDDYIINAKVKSMNDLTGIPTTIKTNEPHIILQHVSTKVKEIDTSIRRDINVAIKYKVVHELAIPSYVVTTDDGKLVYAIGKY